MKLFRFFVRISCNPAGFYRCLSPGRYLTGIEHDKADGAFFPEFGSSDPAVYPFGSARFQAKELRRVGYNVRCVPYIVYCFKLWLEARIKRPWRR